MKSEHRIAAARYASAYDSLSTTVEQAEKNAKELQLATDILQSVGPALQNPQLPAPYKKMVLNEAFKQAPNAAKLISVLIDAKRLGLLPTICEGVNLLLDDRKGISRAIVTTARVLSEAQQKATQKALGARYGKVVEATFAVDPALLAGLTARCNGEFLDGSVQTQLAKLREQIAK